MAFLTLNGLTVRVKSNAAPEKLNEHRLDRDRMFDGSMRVIRQGIYRQWDLTTALLSESDANALLALIKSDDLPLRASGDLIGGTIGVIPVPGTNSPVQTAQGFMRQVTFTLHETPAAFGPTDFVLDFDADNAVTIPTNFNGFHDGGGAYDFVGVLSVTNGVAGGVALNTTSERPGWYAGQTEIGGHAMIRAWGASDNNPMLATLPTALTGLPGVTLVVVARPGNGASHGQPFEIGDGTTGYAGLGQITSIGVGISLAITGWRRGAPLGEPGEITGAWSGTVVSESAVWTGQGPSDAESVSRGLGTTPAGAFTIVAVRVHSSGVVEFARNGTILPLAFTGTAGPFSLQTLLMTSSAGGSLDLSGGPLVDWTRVMVFPRDLSESEIKGNAKELGQRYGIAVAT